MTKISIQKWIAILVSFLMIGTLFSMLPMTNLTASAISCQKDGFDKSRYTLSGNMAEDVATIAKSQKGRTGAQFGYTEAWCDEFVADCLENAGADSSIVGHGGTVADFEAVMRQKKGAVEVSSPQVGDLVFFTYSHVEIVTKVENGTVYCAGGNNGGTGNYKTNYCAGERKLYATARLYLRPNYKNTNVEPPTYARLDKNQVWYDLQDTIELYPTSDKATNYYLTITKDNIPVVLGIEISGTYSISASNLGYGNYHAWISAANSAGGVDSNNIDFSVVESAAYTDIYTSKSLYSLNQTVSIHVDTICAKGQVIGIDKIGFGRVVTKQCDNTYTFPASQLGTGKYSAYFSVYNGSGGVDTKNVQFSICDTVPQNLKIETNGDVFKFGEIINFKFSSDYETEQHISINLDGKEVSLINVTGNNSYSCSFDNAGIYTVRLAAKNMYGESYSQYIKFKVISPIQGDLNQDGTLSLTDLIPLQQSLLRQTTLTADEAQLADYNGDGSINVLDLMLLKRALLAL